MQNIEAPPLKAVFENADLNRLILEIAEEIPDCEEATNSGKRCAKAWLFRNGDSERKGTRYAAPAPTVINCSAYCGARCLDWMTDALKSPPRWVYLWWTPPRASKVVAPSTVGSQLLGKYEMKTFSLKVELPLEKEDYMGRNTVAREYFPILSNDQNKATQWKIGDENISPVKMAQQICHAVGEKRSTLVGFIELPFEVPSDKNDLDLGISFGPENPSAAPWIRPNKFWRADGLGEITSFMMMLDSWNAPIEIPSTALNAGRAQSHPAIINSLF